MFSHLSTISITYIERENKFSWSQKNKNLAINVIVQELLNKEERKYWVMYVYLLLINIVEYIRRCYSKLTYFIIEEKRLTIHLSKQKTFKRRRMKCLIRMHTFLSIIYSFMNVFSYSLTQLISYLNKQQYKIFMRKKENRNIVNINNNTGK